MRKLLILFLILYFTTCPFSFGHSEEMYIVPDGPAIVGGGIIRHFCEIDGERVCIRYIYEGVVENKLLIEKITHYFKDDSKIREFFTLPLKKHRGRKRARFQVGSRTIRLQLNRDGRLSIKEIK